MNIVIILLALVAFTVADVQQCGPLQKLKIKQQWTVVFGSAHHRIDFGTAVFRSFFRRVPEVVQFFARVKGDDLYSGVFKAYSMRVLGGVNMIISAIDDEQIVHSLLRRLRDQHKERQIPRNYFRVFKNSLMRIMPATIGRCFDERAWDVCLDVVAHGVSDY